MIALLKGTVVSMSENALVLDVSGVGYKVFVSPYTLGKAAGLGTLTLHIYTHVREDMLSLYGFLSESELEMFELLISVSGIGPKAGLGILSIADPETICTAVADRDASILTRVSGVGKKTAERVILDLENKIKKFSFAKRSDGVSVAGEADALDALLAMGYAVNEAREALQNIPSDISDVGDRVKAALKYLAKK